MCLEYVGQMPEHPVSESSCFPESINAAGSVILMNDADNISRWSWPGLSYIDDHMSSVAGSGLDACYDPDDNIWVGAIDGFVLRLYKNGSLVETVDSSAHSGITAVSGGGMCYANDRIYIIHNIDASGGDLGQLLAFDVADGSLMAEGFATGFAFKASPTATPDGAVWFHGQAVPVTRRYHRTVAPTSTNTAHECLAPTLPIGTDRMLARRADTHTWIEFFVDGADELDATNTLTCDPVVDGFSGDPLHNFANAAATLAGLVDFSEGIWVSGSARRPRWWAGVAGWT